MLICFCGPKGSGKDTAAQPLLDVGFVRINLADELKWLCAEVFDFSPLSMESQEAKERQFEQPVVVTDDHISALVRLEMQNFRLDEGHSLYVLEHNLRSNYVGTQVHSLRGLLQWIGTAFREQVDKEFWIRIWREKVLAARAIPSLELHLPSPPCKGVVCTDIRYANERQAARDIGGLLVYVDRPGCGGQDDHASENDFGDPRVDYDCVLKNAHSVEMLHDEAAETALFMTPDAVHIYAPVRALNLYFTGVAR